MANGNSEQDGEKVARSSSTLIDIVQALKEQITEKERLLKQKSRALIEERGFVESIIAAIQDAVVVLDARGQIQTANAAACEWLGLSDEDLRGAPVSRLWARPEQRLAFTGARLSQLLSQPSAIADLSLQTPGGEWPVNWRGAPLRAEDGSLRGYVGVARDMRAERRAQDSKLEAVRAMAASVAHEIRNPLGAIQNSAALLLRDLELGDEDRELLEIVREETARISGIVQQFLDFARPSPATLRPEDISGILRDIARIAENDARFQKGIRLELELPDALPAIACDTSKIKQVLWNLINNALDALGAEGEIVLAARASERNGEAGLSILVSDTGHGIPAELLPKLTEPFFTSKARGTGLGLAITKSIIAAHRGEMSIDSSPKGTIVGLWFPASPEAESPD